jgi:hypothetical protein
MPRHEFVTPPAPRCLPSLPAASRHFPLLLTVPRHPIAPAVFRYPPLSLAVFHCPSPPSATCCCLPRPLTVPRRLLLPFAASRRLSPPLSASRCLPYLYHLPLCSSSTTLSVYNFYPHVSLLSSPRLHHLPSRFPSTVTTLFFHRLHACRALSGTGGLICVRV